MVKVLVMVVACPEASVVVMTLVLAPLVVDRGPMVHVLVMVVARPASSVVVTVTVSGVVVLKKV